MLISNTCSIGYPHDGRADNAAYRHDRRADKRRNRHDRRADSLSQYFGHNMILLASESSERIMIQVTTSMKKIAGKGD